jgi:hypothetical protein
MPGPGKGKQTQKKKWCENTSNLNMNITAVNTVIMASNTMALSVTIATLTMSLPSDVTTVTPPANEMTSKTASYTASLPTTSISTTGVMTSDPNDASNINAIDSTPDTSALTYSHEEVCILLEEARLDEYQEGYDEGYMRKEVKD